MSNEKNKQYNAPAPSQPKQAEGQAMSRPQWLTEAEKALEAKGWRRCGLVENITLWEDPQTSQPLQQRHAEVEIPATEGGTTRIMQKVAGPCQWQYRTEEALNVQRQRDEWPAKEAARKELLAQERAAALADGRLPKPKNVAAAATV
jgi:hypothetical protein